MQELEGPAIVRPAHSLGELASAINSEHKAYEFAVHQTLEHARQLGEFLRKAKFLCRHGEWGPWVKKNLNFSRQTAATYMRVAAEWDKCKAALHLADALRMLTDEPDEEEEEPAPSVEGKSWHSLPLREFLKADDYVWEALEAAKVQTAGEMFARMRDGMNFGLMGGDIKTVRDQIEALEGFVKSASEGRAKRYKPGRGPAGSKEGSDLFDWRGFDGRFGAIVRDIDKVAKNYEVKADPRIEGARRLLGEFVKLWSQVKKDLTGGKK